MVITRYVLKNLLGVSLFVTVVLTMLVMLTQSLRFLELIIETGAPAGSFFHLIALAVPRFLEVILPLSLVTAVLFIYNKMISENEMVVLRAAGFTQLDLMKPALKLGLIGFLLMIFLTMWASPASHGRLENLRNDIKTQYASLLLREGVFNTVEDGLMIYMDARLPGGEMNGLVIHDTRDPDIPPVTIIAEKGRLISQSEGETQVLVYNGRRQSYNPTTGTLDILNFEQYILSVTNIENAPRFRWKKADERTIWELLDPAAVAAAPIGNKAHDIFSAEIHRRVTTPMAVFSFILIALACVLAGSFNRRGQSRRIMLAAGLIIVFQSLYLALSNALEDKSWAVPLLYIALILPSVAAIYAVSPAGEFLRQRFVHRRKRRPVP